MKNALKVLWEKLSNQTLNITLGRPVIICGGVMKWPAQ